MSDTKLQFRIGSIEFSGEGDKEWLAKQLDKLIEHAPRLLSVAPESGNEGGGGGADAGHRPMASDPSIAKQPLATFLRDKNATKNQVKKFLAAAVWLEARGQ